MPSKPEKPDLDWSQVRETVMMLDLAISRIERTMKDGDESITTLAELFTSMMGNVQIIGKAAGKMPDSEDKEAIQDNFKSVSGKMNEAIVAFQFYDLMTQRLSHISHSLASLAELIGDSRRLYNPYEWYGLQQMIRSKYILDEDKAMFDAILEGASVEEALQISVKKPHIKASEADDENVEIF
ncbi:MAG: hypothetical protein AB7S75_11835 [Desulfococcaceae bacterium]